MPVGNPSLAQGLYIICNKQRVTRESPTILITAACPTSKFEGIHIIVSMDRKIEKKKWPPVRIAKVGGGAIVVFFITYLLIFQDRSSKLYVTAERLSIATVEQGAFLEFIPITGTVVPIQTIYMDAVTGGRVAEKYLEAGNMVKKGDPILRLENQSLQMSIANQETQLLEQLNNLQNTRMNMEQNLITSQSNLLDMDYQFEQQKIAYLESKTLYEKNLTSRREHIEIENQYHYYERKLDLLRVTAIQDSIRRVIQLRQMNDSERRIVKNLGMVQLTLDNLILRAPISGQLTSLDAEIGESKGAGQRLGQIDVLDNYRVQANIDEHYITKVYAGLGGEFDLGGKTYRITASKIYPEVQGGQFQIDLMFTSDTPPDIRRGQTLRVRLELGNPVQALLLARGAFTQKTGGRWAYVLDSSGEVAVRQDISLGRQNPQNLEVLGGLVPGDRVIISSYESFGDNEKLILRFN